jgi:hypothetical protein
MIKITQNPDGTFSFEIGFEDSIKWLFGSRYKRKEDRFLRTLEFMGDNRGRLSRIANTFYRTKKDIRLLHEDIPLILNKHFDHQLHPMSSITCTYEDQCTKLEPRRGRLPNERKDYVNNIIDYKYAGNVEVSPYKNHFCYRLVDLKSVNELHFEHCRYFDFVNTCEYDFFLFAEEVLTNIQKIDQRKFDIGKLHRTLDPHSFTNRYLVPGINTLLIFGGGDKSEMYLHMRNKKTTAEAINVKHVVPAGTFQPIHMDDGNHEVDFSLYVNVLREFGEELAGDQELVHPRGVRENVLERPSLAPIHKLLRNGKGKMYFAGVTFDSLNLKPEILSILLLSRKDYEKLVGPINPIENYEGDPFAVKFDKKTLEKYAFDENMLSAGAGCLYMAYKNFDQLVKEIRHL